MKKILISILVLVFFGTLFWYFEKPLMDHFSFQEEKEQSSKQSDDIRNIINGILEFRKNLSGEYKDLFSQLKKKQEPDTLFISCSDSRIVPSLISSTNPGDAFVLRNVGNLIPVYTLSLQDNSAPAAIDYAINTLKISDILLCGHSNCGAMKAITNNLDSLPNSHLKSWLKNGEDSLIRVNQGHIFNQNLSKADQVSQENVLVQMEHIKTYPSVKAAIENNKLRIHGLWFDVGHASVYYYDITTDQFVLIDEKKAEELLKRLEEKLESLDS